MIGLSSSGRCACRGEALANTVRLRNCSRFPMGSVVGRRAIVVARGRLVTPQPRRKRMTRHAINARGYRRCLMMKRRHQAAEQRREYRRHNQPKNKNNRQKTAEYNERCCHPFEHDLQNRPERNIEIDYGYALR